MLTSAVSRSEVSCGALQIESSSILRSGGSVARAMSETASQDSQSRSDWVLLKQGAEARVYTCQYRGKPAVVKERFVKTYRLPELDKKLTNRRMNQEVRSMARCKKHGIHAPAVYHHDTARRLIYMERIEDGVLLKDYIKDLEELDDRSKQFMTLVELIGVVLAQMHDIDLIHGDLTTSNMIYNAERHELTLIDFGLSFVSGLTEDKGVDLYVLERAFLSSHPGTEPFFEQLLKSYSERSEKAKTVVQKLEEVRMRGRKRTMVG